MNKLFYGETLQREVESRRSSSAGLPVTSAEKETCPTGSEYGAYPPLDKAQLRDGYKLCVENARRLISDARALAEAGRYSSAQGILLLALEDLGSALQLYEANRSGVQDWESWWRRYFSHPKDLESASLGIAKREKATEGRTLVPEDLAHVNFDRKHGKFIAPPEDEDREVVAVFEKEAAYAEGVLKALPSHAFERWEYEVMLRQSPEIAPLVLYARIEELLGQEPTVSEGDLVAAIARDLGRSRDVFAAGFERWKVVSPKARAYVDLIRRVQDKMKKPREAEEGEAYTEG